MVYVSSNGFVSFDNKSEPRPDYPQNVPSFQTVIGFGVNSAFIRLNHVSFEASSPKAFSISSKNVGARSLLVVLSQKC